VLRGASRFFGRQFVVHVVIADFQFPIADLESRKTRTIVNRQSKIDNVVAERVGFEPTERFPVHSISSAASSTTPAPLRALTIVDF
jgi:hypothetical protein